MILSRWGVEEFQKRYFLRQSEYRRTIDKILGSGRSNVISENSLELRLKYAIKTKGVFIEMIRSRIIAPLFQEGNIVLPQIVGIDPKSRRCIIFFYAPIFKALNGKVSGLTDVLTMFLGNRGCSLIAFIAGARDGKFGTLAAVGIYDIIDKTQQLRAFLKTQYGVQERDIPFEDYEELFSRTFDSDIWTSDETWKSKELN